METSLHRQLKERYAEGDAAAGGQARGPTGSTSCNADQLVEIQHGSLAAIRDKIARLLRDHRVLIVKPILARKRILKLKRRGGSGRRRNGGAQNAARRSTCLTNWSSSHACFHTTTSLWKCRWSKSRNAAFPGHGRKRWRHAQRSPGRRCPPGRYSADLSVSDGPVIYASCCRAISPQPFHTGHLAEQLHVRRWVAQRIAYCMRMRRGNGSRQTRQHAALSMGLSAAAIGPR